MNLEEFIKILEKYPKDCKVKYLKDPVRDPDPDESVDYKESFINYIEEDNTMLF